jgi:hypothetical protein
MKITYDPPPRRPGWIARLVELTMARLVALLAALPR